MDSIIRIAATTLTTTEQELYNNGAGAIVTKILLYNPNTTATEVTLSFDGVIFLFNLAIKETQIIDFHSLINILKATGDSINIHVTGVQMEVTT